MNYELRSCLSKYGWRKHTAKEIASKMTRKRGVRYHAYHCKFCRRYHVGHRQTDKLRPVQAQVVAHRTGLGLSNVRSVPGAAAHA